MSVFVFEHCRPQKEHDQMLLFIDNINYVKHFREDIDWLSRKFIDYYNLNGERHKLIIKYLDVADIPTLVNDFVFYKHIPQPCNMSIYIMDTTNIKELNIVIRDIIENNIAKV